MSWTIYQRNFALCLGVAFVAILISIGLGLGSARIEQPLVRELGGDWNPPGWIVGVLFDLGRQLFGTWIGAGIIIFHIRLARGEQAALGDMFSAGRFLPALIPAMLILWVINTILRVIFFAPMAVMPLIGFATVPTYLVVSIYISLIYGMFMPLVVDRNLGAIESLQTSAQITAGNRLLMLLLFIVALLFAIAGALACGVGLLFVLPQIWLMSAVCYLRMIGENVQ